MSIVDRFLKLQKKLKMPNLTAYSYRHTFATEMLKVGMDVETLAELMGNSALVIRQHYSHLLADAKAPREKLERFRTAAGAGAPSSAGQPAQGASVGCPPRSVSARNAATPRLKGAQLTNRTDAPIARHEGEDGGTERGGCCEPDELRGMGDSALRARLSRTLRNKVRISAKFRGMAWF